MNMEITNKTQMQQLKKISKAEKEELWCHYSDLPSPAAYMECADYDGMGNQGRVTQINKSK